MDGQAPRQTTLLGLMIVIAVVAGLGWAVYNSVAGGADPSPCVDEASCGDPAPAPIAGQP